MAIANRKNVAVRAAFLFLSSQDVLKAVPWMGLIWRALAGVDLTQCFRQSGPDFALWTPSGTALRGGSAL